MKRHLWKFAAAAMFPATALAGIVPTPVPEPGVLELVVTAAVVAAVIAVRKRRK